MPTMTICVTVDWEGLRLAQASLDAMTAFRKKFTDVPLTHFICPAYLTRGGDLAAVSAKIRSQVRISDEVALHIHCWQTLVEAAGVTPTLAPSWYIDGNLGPDVPYGDGKKDMGHGVALGAYTSSDIGKILRFSNKLLVDQKITPTTPVSFRCGGWMSADPVQTALQACSIANDSSSTDAPYFVTINPNLMALKCCLGDWLGQLWGTAAVATPAYLANGLSRSAQPAGGTSTTQPYSISTVFQVPDNGVLADYLTEQMMYDRLQEAWALAARGDVVHVCGFHQESATWRNLYKDSASNIENLSKALSRFLATIGSMHADGEEASPTLGERRLVFNTDTRVRNRLEGVPFDGRWLQPADDRPVLGGAVSESGDEDRFWG